MTKSIDYTKLPTDAAREAAAIMAQDTYTLSGDYAKSAATLRGVRATFQGFEAMFSQYVGKHGDLPGNDLLKDSVSALGTVAYDYRYNVLMHALPDICVELDQASIAAYSKDFLWDFDHVISVFEGAAAFVLSIAGCSEEERMAGLEELKKSEPFKHAVPNPVPDNYGEAEWQYLIDNFPVDCFAGLILDELEEVVAGPCDASPLPVRGPCAWM